MAFTTDYDGFTSQTPVADPAARGRRIAICGAGPGGLSAAIALHQAGFDVRVFERHSQITGLGGAILINAIGIHIFRSYGVAMDDIYTASVTKLKSHLGHHRVLWQVDHSLLNEAKVDGWQSGMMRSEVYERMLSVVPDGMIVVGHALTHFDDKGDEVVLHFANGAEYRADLVVGADGIDSVVRQQLFGQSPSIALNINAWLGWSEFDGASREEMIMRHSARHQVGYAPLRYRGKDCFEWWFLEPATLDDPLPADPLRYILSKTRDFESPVTDVIAATGPEGMPFRWQLKVKKPLTSWARGRAVLLGDACHATSPYAGYGAGMAIEDGFFLGRYLAGVDLGKSSALGEGLRLFQDQRLRYTNKIAAFAQRLGNFYHYTPAPIRPMRDFVLNRGLLDKAISKSYTKDAQILLRSILDAEEFKRSKIDK